MMPSLSSQDAACRLAEVRSQIEQAAHKSGRSPQDITLLAVSKTFPAELVELYTRQGLHDFGESYIQEAREKIDALIHLDPAPRWHFIGHLQTNKAKYAAMLFQVIHSIDSVELAQALDKRLAVAGKQIDAYIQINVSGESSKSGMNPADLPFFLEQSPQFKNLNFIGLMTMPPYDPDPEKSRPYFRALRILRDDKAAHLKGLSMGMSGDYQVAIEEGATIIRVGTALFGERNYT